MFINFMSTAGTIFILSSFLDAFVCDFELEPEVVYKERDMLCYGSEHQTFMGIGGIGALLFYLMSSFTFPNMQLDMNGTDFKYDPTFIVILTQAKLLIAGLGSFFPDEQDIPMQCSFQALILIFLALYCKKAKPCKIYSYNIIDIGFYLTAAWMCISSALLHRTGNKTGGVLCLMFGTLTLFILTVVFYCRSRKEESDLDEMWKDGGP